MTHPGGAGRQEVTVVLASNNPGKVDELRRLLPEWVRILTASDAGVTLPEETGTTFAANALLKARAAVQQTGHIALADDSGLEVDALGGEPGVRSARYAGEPTDDAANNALLLERLRAVPSAERTARFRSAVAIVTPEGREHVAEGTVEGVILEQPRGSGGFGYDPLFQPAGSDRTMAELATDEKNRISHRGRAFRAAAAWLLPILEAARREGSDGEIARRHEEKTELS
ncbi:RdgB/HAM1 family non-canonical purine NTP pyrophosphatase [Sphaerobacter thermophilus]|jgi:XTP/dITP diphosphohydrolase|uniref:dITP/XTP pyrophosphatase n=1 Tax=Sphaerobacter thermophilus (strain ATCC 49802 / DSM 20745 / KCCM 41009 / NCIMB 13125 / S 6022) TaxID=479434 RepID=D1C3B5_SPHTD|nr:RdgB/HAM1 family non-canonical purine NTP pyrophosphatase [Sphaerobacter thermophilus]ACZ38732.1 non-canonical purine NTP pyrophosphatase, rdgB/HAM1 family [Sphaerobacter thermophilus DSM 20745]